MSTLRIIPNLSNKTLRSCGSVAVGELVALTIYGVTDIESLRVRIRYGGKDCAVFPAPEDETGWTVSDGDAVGALNLNTDRMRSAFFGVMDQTTIMFGLIIEQVDADMLCEGSIGIKNWPANEGEGVPYNLTDWPNTVGEFDSRLVALAAAVEAHKEDVAAHDSLFALKASKSVVDSHIANTDNPHSVTLAQLGGVTTGAFAAHQSSGSAHSALFATKASKDALETHTQGVVRGHVAIDESLDGLEAGLGTHDHNVSGESGGRIQHASLLGSGSQTHAQIDSTLAGLQAAVNYLTGAQSGGASLDALRFASISAACRSALEMPNGTDRQRKEQFAFFVGKLIEASEKTI